MTAVVPSATTQQAMLLAWEQGLPRKADLPPSDQQLMTPVLADAFGTAMQNGARYAMPPIPPQAQAHPRQDMSYPYPGGLAQGQNRSAATAPSQHQAPGHYPQYHRQMQPLLQGATQNMRQNNPAHYPFPMQYPQYPQPQQGYEMYRPPEPHQAMPAPTGDPASYQNVAYNDVSQQRSYMDFKRPHEDNLNGSVDGDDDHARALKRPRLVWTPPLHKRFVDAVNHLGIKNAVPKTIMQLMNVEGLTRENVASHLQKYRLYLNRLQGCSESTMENSPSEEGGKQPAPLSPGKGNSGGSDGGNSGNLAQSAGPAGGALGASSDEDTAGEKENKEEAL